MEKKEQKSEVHCLLEPIEINSTANNRQWNLNIAEIFDRILWYFADYSDPYGTVDEAYEEIHDGSCGAKILSQVFFVGLDNVENFSEFADLVRQTEQIRQERNRNQGCCYGIGDIYYLSNVSSNIELVEIIDRISKKEEIETSIIFELKNDISFRRRDWLDEYAKSIVKNTLYSPENQA